MPEIKHQFTGGKMNKDLDERLVPNGEYRDALNIEVSTSEGSDVGTVQNILGNSLIAGQDFISENSVCVGSIADEKNDKLYYFVTQNNLLLNGGFLGGSEGWLDGNPEWTFSNNQAVGTSGEDGTMHASAPGVVDGNMYTMTYDIVVASTSGSLILANHTTYASTLNSFTGNNNVYLINEDTIGTHTVQWEQGPSTTRQNNIWLYNSSTYDGTIDNLFVFRSDIVRSCIIEYDFNTNTITPVLVDTIGDVLKFNPDNIITGINIIDDLLLWTDNENEPKKINIQRSIEGTDPSGITHTNFENTKTGLSTALKEEHITVIKKAPKLAPSIGLISERSNDTGKIYSGIMRITTPSVPPTEKGTGQTNLQNQSSMWVSSGSGNNWRYDFGGIKIGHEFDSQIETDINGDSGFVLDWQPGDIILFKEFGGDLYDEIPSVPLSEYSVKAKILNTWVSNPTDTASEITQNGDFDIPNYNGSAPKSWVFQSGGNFTYLPTSNSIKCDNSPQYHKVFQSSPVQPLENDTDYNVTIELSNVNSGYVGVYMVITDQSDTTKWFTISDSASTSGIHTFTLTTTGETSQNTYTNWQTYQGKIIIQTGGGVFDGIIENISIIKANATNAMFRFEVLALNNPPLAPTLLSELKFVMDKMETEEKLFEFKFPRFAYRYQYEDGEYSTMSPFSPIAFLPGSFDYHPKKGYNLGMTNRITDITIKDFVTNIQDGVVAIDILYKDDSSPNIYVVDTIKPQHTAVGGGSNEWNENEYTVSSEQISKILPSNQLLRSWDNVPRKALAQDISGNRVIYGNYVQGFNLKNGDEEYYPDFLFNIQGETNDYLYPKKSIKSLREYQLGVVFVDEYGRETPVISNFSGNKKLEKADGDKSNKLQVGFNNNSYPKTMKYFKFFIKETSGEYYNMAMDRYYDAEDGQVWLSFPSSDRNKVDIDTFLILKKGIESNDIVAQKGKYKVLDIQNEAPDFIKQNKTLIIAKSHIKASEEIFSDTLVDTPLLGEDSFKMNYDKFQGTVGSRLHENKEDLYVEFTNETNNTSKKYRISEITADIDAANSVASRYSVKLHKVLGEDVNFITDSASGLNPTKINDGTIVNIYQYKIENSAKFDGRFFVKINIDEVFDANINITTSDDTKYRTTFSKKLYYLSDSVKSLHRSALTGQNDGLYDDSNYGNAPGFGSFAPFFRNYKDLKTHLSYSGKNVGQYSFGKDTSTSRPWLQELSWYTTWAATPTFNRDDNDGNKDEPPGHKVADKHDWNESERQGVFNAAGEQTKGDVWFIDGGPYYGKRGSNSNTLHWASSDGTARYIVPNAGTSDGIVTSGNYTYLDIAIGGIYDNFQDTALPDPIPEFFNIGRDGGNTNYNGGNQQKMVSKFYPGQKFRFREDPNQEVYTIQPGINEDRRYVRWNTIPLALSGSANFYQWEYEIWEQTGSTSGTSAFDSYRNYSDHGTYNQWRWSNYTVFATQLSPNFTKGWRPRVVNSSGGAAMPWEPTNGGTTGPISGGLVLSIDHSATPWSSGDLYVEVDDLIATHTDGTRHAITTNMILTSHSDAGTTFSVGTLGSEPLVIRSIDGTGPYKLYLSGYTKFLTDNAALISGVSAHDIFTNVPDANEELVFEQPAMNGYSQYSVNRINAQHGAVDKGGITAIGYNIDFVEAIVLEPLLPQNPAIWETEPKESTDLDIYYEASGLNPLNLEEDTRYTSIPAVMMGGVGSIVEHIPNNYIETGTIVHDVFYSDGEWNITLTDPSGIGSLVDGIYIAADDKLKITKPNGDIIIVTITGWPAVVDGNANPDGDGRTTTFTINRALYSDKTKYILNWHNCYSFGNGVESNRIRDNFNLPYISNGVKVSTTLDEGLDEEHRKYGLIYSGIYNSNSSTNNLNQFIAAEKITKDVNPLYGSIQKLHARDSDLVTLCEDKCLRILANKDAVFNADGNPQLTANENVLGQTIPFSGEFGISKNPESFASESYRVYFTDKVRGAVIRLSKDGLTPISMFGMKDWFRDNLKLANKIRGSYDDKKDEYNITLKDNETMQFTSVESIQIIDTALVEIESYYLNP